MVDFDMNQAISPTQHYLNLKEYYKNMIEKMNEKVVLSKITSDGTSKSAEGGR